MLFADDWWRIFFRRGYPEFQGVMVRILRVFSYSFLGDVVLPGLKHLCGGLSGFEEGARTLKE